MQMKSHQPSLIWSSDSPHAAKPHALTTVRGNTEQTVAALSARVAALRARQVSLASLCDELTIMTQPDLTHALVDQRLFETARVAAEILELAERAHEQAGGGKVMRMLADTCFDAVLRIDASRHELAGSIDAETAHQRRQRHKALRCAQRALTALEQRLARALAN
jgi:hypothetical protein